MQSLKSLRAAIDDITPRGRGRRYPTSLKAAIARYAIDARARGVKAKVIEAELGISWETLHRWMLGARRVTPVAVRVVADPPSRPTLVSPSGWRIEGLSFEEIRALIAR